MNNKKKMIVAGAMAAVLTFSGQFAQLDNFGVQRAEAFGLGDLAKTALDVFVKTDPESLKKRSNSMIENLCKAAICYGQAAIDVSEALGLDDGQRAQMQAALTNLNNNKTDFGAMKQVGETTKVDKQTLENAAKNLMDSGDQEKIAKANELIKKSKAERQAANDYKILALKDATLIVVGTAKNLTAGSVENAIVGAMSFSDAANTAKEIGKIIGDNHKNMKDALKAYEKKNNIKEVSKKEAKELTKDLVMS